MWPRSALSNYPGFVLTDHQRDGRRLALVDMDHGRVKVLETGPEGAKVLCRWETPAANAGALSPDGEQVLVNCSVTGTNAGSLRLKLHRVADGSVLRELPGIPSCDAAWSADGTVALTSNGQKLSTLWNTANWQPLATLEGQLGGDISSFALAPDGSYAAINRDEFIYLVSTRNGALLARLELPGASGLCSGIRFLPDGRRFAVLWRDGRIDLLDPAALQAALKPLGLGW
jgi:WD40 repeat protein